MKTKNHINSIALALALCLIAQVNVPSARATDDSSMAINDQQLIVAAWPYVGPMLISNLGTGGGAGKMNDQISTGGSGGEDRVAQISTGGSGGEDRVAQISTGGSGGEDR